MISIIITVKYHLDLCFIMRIVHKLTILAVLAVTSIQSLGYELDSVVTTGTRTPKLLNDSPVSVNVITAEQLSVISSGTLAEALNFIPGVVLTRSAKDGYNVQMQGFDGDHVLILLNGQRMVSPTGSSVDLDQVNALDVERIEILKGAASVMYGSAAMGGVMNIITKPIEKQTTRLSYEVGSYANNAISDDPVEHRVSVSSSVVNQAYKGQINYQHINNPGFKYDDDAKVENGTSAEKNFLDGSFTLDTALGQFNYHPQYFKETRYRNEEDTNVPGIGFIPDAYRSEVERITQSFEYQSKHNFIARVRIANHDESSGHESKASRSAELSIGAAELQQSWMFEFGEIVSGIEFDYEEMDIPDDSIFNKRRESTQLFSQLDIYISDNFEALAGVRAQYDSGFGWHQAGRVSGMFRQNFTSGNQLNLRFGVGQSYKVPSLKELHYILDHTNVGSGYVVIGNEELVPEETVSYNVSASIDFINNIQFEINAYHSDSNNFIENEFNEIFTDVWGVNAYVYQNISKVETQGGDVNLKLPINTDHSFNISYSYLEARNGNHQRLENRPRNQIKLNLNSSFQWLNTQVITYAVYQSDEAFALDDLSTTGTDEDEGYLGEYNNEWISLNISVTQQPSKHVTLRYGIQNILDEHKNTDVSNDYFDVREEDSRRIYLGMSYEF
jgi:outer membrane receptor for ferrienterochelin and colicins